MGAYAYAETLVVEPTFGSAGHWYVVVLGSVIAPAAQGPAAGAMLKHAYQSLTLNPEWMRTQHQLIAQATQGVLNAAAIAKQISDAQIRRSQQTMREMARQSDNFNDVLLGQQYTRAIRRPARLMWCRWAMGARNGWMPAGWSRSPRWFPAPGSIGCSR